MGRKPVEFSAHCQGRLNEYGISRGQVRQLVVDGQRVSGPRPGQYNVVGGTARFRLADRVRTRKVVVGRYEDARRILIRSVIPILTRRELEELRTYRERMRLP